MEKDGEDSLVVVTRDSFALCNSHLRAPLSVPVALRLGLPVTLFAEEGLRLDLPAEWAQQPKFATNRRVLVWTCNDKMLASACWTTVELPANRAPPASVVESHNDDRHDHRDPRPAVDRGRPAPHR